MVFETWCMLYPILYLCANTSCTMVDMGQSCLKEIKYCRAVLISQSKLVLVTPVNISLNNIKICFGFNPNRSQGVRSKFLEG